MNIELTLIVALAVSAAAACIDARTGLIPNLLTLPAAAVGLMFHVMSTGRAGFLSSASGLVLALFIPLALYLTTGGQAIGGGDVKLFAALGAWVGPLLGLQIQLSAFVLLAVFALIQLAFRGRLLAVLANALRMLLNPFLPRKWRRTLSAEALTEMRMGPAIAAGVLAVVVRDQLLVRLPWLA